jgi:type VI protein secretion system component VasF
MSLYREARSGRRRLWIGASVAVVAIAAVAGLVLATTGGTQSQAEKLESLQQDVEPALAALELIPIHYGSPNPTTHAAAADQLDVARKTIASVESELETLDPAGTSRVLSDLSGLALLVRTTGQTARVERLATKTTADLRAVVRLD